MWNKVIGIFDSGCIAVTTEIYEEMIHIPGKMGEWLKANKKLVLLEVGQPEWDSDSYVKISSDMNLKHHAYISEYCGGSPRTVGLNDISIIALAKALGTPVVSMEVQASKQIGSNKRRIPDVCELETVKHYTFNDFLRLEKIKL